MKNRYVVTLMLGALLALGGCASSLSGDVYSRDDARAPQTVRMGTVESVRLVQIEGTKTVIGPAAGAAIGGVAGNSVGGGRGSAIAAIVGALAGGRGCWSSRRHGRCGSRGGDYPYSGRGNYR